MEPRANSAWARALRRAGRMSSEGRAALPFVLACAGVLLAVGPFIGTAHALTLTTPYPAVSVQPGQSASLDLQVKDPQAVRVDLSVTKVPTGWKASIKGGGRDVGAVFTDSADNPRVQLEVDVPADAATGSYQMVVQARGPGGTVDLPVTLTVASTAQGGTTLQSAFPSLRGPADAAFRFSIDLHNGSTEERTYNISAKGPEGWQVSLKPSGSDKETPSVPVEGEGTQALDLQVTPPADTKPGQYPITVRASGGGEDISLDLGIEVTGTYTLTFTTPDQRLNAQIKANGATKVPLVLKNDGTGPLLGVSLSATPPADWEVTFEPQVVDQIGAGESLPVTAIFTPAKGAIAGDYVVSVSARADQANATSDLRVTVKTSTWWGLVGVLVIVLALAGLFFIFRRFGHR